MWKAVAYYNTYTVEEFTDSRERFKLAHSKANRVEFVWF